jgi:hypothetical protein
MARARALSGEIDRLLAGKDVACKADGAGRLDALCPPDVLCPPEELAVARRLSAAVASFPPVPAGLEWRVQEIVCSRPSSLGHRRGWRLAPTTSTFGTAAVSALATALVFLVVLIVVPVLSGGQRSWAQMIEVLLGQTRIRVTPTLQASSTLVDQPLRAASLTPKAGATLAEPGLPRRELLRDLVAVELLIGRAPSTPKTLPQGYALLEIAAVSYPDLPSWISQPFYVELCYGVETAELPLDLRLRQYRLLFREFGRISGVQVASGAVKDMEQVDVGGATGMLLTLDPEGGDASGRTHPTYTVLWERDGLLLELETDSLSRESLLEIARSVR